MKGQFYYSWSKISSSQIAIDLEKKKKRTHKIKSFSNLSLEGEWCFIDNTLDNFKNSDVYYSDWMGRLFWNGME